MKTLPLIAFGLLLLVVLAALSLKRTKGRGKIDTRSKPLMTKREQAMYWRLQETFPEAVVLAQVSFSALITSARNQRNRYDRKTADFVLCDRSMTVTAVIELDDASHKGREMNDSARDSLLTGAGYTTLRFANIPDAADLREQLQLKPANPPSKLLRAPIAPPVAKSP